MPRVTDRRVGSLEEDEQQFQNALRRGLENHNLEEETAIWVCTLAIYQAHKDGGRGPSIPEQLDLQTTPFECVINNLPPLPNCAGGLMLAVHTTSQELYGRLWW